MKKAVVLVVVLMLSVALFGQNKFKGFFKPVTYETPLIKSRALGSPTNVWLFRPAIELSAVQFIWNKETKGFDSKAFSSTGAGIGYQHYVDLSGKPYNDFGFNALILFNTSTSEEPVTMSFAGTVNAFRFVSVGAGYNIGLKSFFILTGVTHNF